MQNYGGSRAVDNDSNARRLINIATSNSLLSLEDQVVLMKVRHLLLR